ncbi:MAG: enoyl-CoA hydratase-related protein [Candidatus Nanopelagicales bacterium]
MVEEVLYQVSNGVATITLNRPERRNAFTLTMVNAWADLLDRASSDDGVKVIVITGAGNAFCAGIDLDVLAALDPSALARREFLTQDIHRVALAMERLDKPVIAAVAGAAVGAGMDMALMCDMRFAAESARFSAAYVRIGVVPGDGGCYFLPKLVGMGKALELLLTGDTVTGAEAERMGMVNAVLPDENLVSHVQALAERIAAQPPLSVRLIKRAAYQSQNTDLRTALDLVASHMGVIMTTQDHHEALAAFREKRPGNFQGR